MGTHSSRKDRGTCVAMLFVGLCLSGHRAVRPQNAVAPGASCAELISEVIRWADEIVVVPVDASTLRIAEAAIDRWERCEEYAIAFPRFVVGAGRGRRVTVDIEKRLPGLGYCGVFVGETITVHRRVRVDERILSCPPSDRVLAHELGHVLGLRDVGPRGGCPTFIMSEIVKDRPPIQWVGRDECNAVDRKWLTSYERDDLTH